MRKIITILLALLLIVQFKGLAQRISSQTMAGNHSIKGKLTLQKEKKIKRNERKYSSLLTQKAQRKAKGSMGSKIVIRTEKKELGKTPPVIQRKDVERKKPGINAN
jgi:hypothetical protein